MNRVHFIGVSGIGVSAVAEISLTGGLKVSGSADMENEQTEMLEKKGMKFFLGHRGEHVNSPDLVVRSAAVSECNPEVLEAKRKGIPVYLYSEYLGMLMGQKKGIAVAGTHGKTSTTAILAKIFFDSELFPTVVCGGVMNDFSSNAISGMGDYFISEACEYNRSFLHLKKWYAVVTNIEPDHLDYYKNIDDLKGAFKDFLKETDPRGFSVVNGDDGGIREILKEVKDPRIFTVGFENDNQYRITNLRNRDGYYSFELEVNYSRVINLTLPIPGKFNCMNAALSAVLALNMGIEKNAIEGSIGDFRGTKRRLECIGKVGDNLVYSDYAHHPTEISYSIVALRERHIKKNITLVFQPHQYSRTSLLFNGFVKELKKADTLILTEIYRQRDSDYYVNSVKGSDLFEKLKKFMHERIMYVREKWDVIPMLKGLGCRDSVIVFMGAGDIDDVARKYVFQIKGY